MTLIEKIRQARVVRIPVDKMIFIARRPTVEEFASIYRDGLKDPDIARKFVTGWENVLERDIFKDGDETVIPFDSEVWSEFIADHPKIWEAVTKQVLQSTQEHIKSLADSEKNSRAG